VLLEDAKLCLGRSSRFSILPSGGTAQSTTLFLHLALLKDILESYSSSTPQTSKYTRWSRTLAGDPQLFTISTHTSPVCSDSPVKHKSFDPVEKHCQFLGGGESRLLCGERLQSNSVHLRFLECTIILLLGVRSCVGLAAHGDQDYALGLDMGQS
jgi:hypothetical protein